MNNLVKTITRLNNVSYTALNEILEITSFVQYKKKSVLCASGKVPQKIFFIKSGIVRAYIKNSNGTEFNKTFFFNNHFAGAFPALTQGKVSQVTLECITDCEILEANYTAVNKLLDTNIELATFSRRLLEKVFISFDKRETELATLSATERYVRFLDRFEHIDHHIPQYHIASHLGITPIQLSRIRKELR
jgi:CRP-like cAMP-binding protein